ncbi:MAG: Mitochondrial distribution and morphology protein 12 [Ramalina farinacea]|uniref:Mitochondrial distribution and morphology protein 12 n=1 Tax=Ramalina farinacea TaxID=258253 RepID=A0AA43TWD6_9LECA|nr:Mitochondrial distribution and morphology protein 12 [Ramalina farinacea]
MSITINWSALTNPTADPPSPSPSPSTTDPSQNDLAISIRDFIHAKFQTLTLPRFIRRVHVHDFDFGAQAPEVRLLDVTDPLSEFYESDDDDDDEDASTPPPRQDGATQREEEGIRARRAAVAPEIPPPRATAVMGAGTPAGLGIGAAAAAAAGGGGGGFSYFHLNPHGILGASGTATPFSPSPWGPAAPTAAAQPPTSSRHEIPTSPTPSKSRDRDLDLQTTLHVVYDGDMSLGLTAEVMLDYPMPSFVGIPLELRICGIRFDGVGVVAYLRGRQTQEEGDGDDGDGRGRGKVKFCFLGEEEARVLLAGEGGEESDGEGRGEKRGEVEGNGGGGLLKEIRIESEIGRKGEGKQVLKNVGKVERFVLEQVRRIFEEEFVWPSFWTVLV